MKRIGRKKQRASPVVVEEYTESVEILVFTMVGWCIRSLILSENKKAAHVSMEHHEKNE